MDKRPPLFRPFVPNESHRMNDLPDAVPHWESVLPAADAGERLRLLIDILNEMPQMVWATDPDGAHFFYNKQWYDYTGLSREKSLGFGFANALHPDDAERTLAWWRRAWEAGENYEIEYRFLRRDGAARWFVGRATPVRDPETGRVAMWVGTCTDIHEQKGTQARLLAALQREAIQNQIAGALRRTMRPEAVLETACREVAAALDVSRAYYAEIDENAETATIAHDVCRGVPSWAGTYPLDAFGGPVIGDLKAGRTVVVHDTENDPRTAASFASVYAPTQIRAYVAVPYLRGGKWVAAFAVNASDGPRAWADDEVRLLETIAAQTEAVTDLARLYAREHRTAQAFQNTVSPQPKVRVGAYRFASHYAAALDESAIGGDFYDQFPLPGGRVGVVVGDVSGKGLAAAVQTALVKFTLRGFAGEDPTPGRALTRLNHAVVSQNALTGFVTLCFVVLDPTKTTLSYASAGHEPPLLHRPGGGEPRELLPTGPVLGIMDDLDYDDASLPFTPGDRLLLYTDGLTEARGKDDFLGVERVAAVLRASAPGEPLEETKARLLRDAARFAPEGFRDDLALLLVEATAEAD
jgi:PAS domain S-box-containing protein